MTKFWKTYFWVLVGLYALAVVGYIFARSLPSLQHLPPDHFSEALSAMAMVGALTGVYGYSYRKTFLTKNAWKGVFLFVVAVHLYGFSKTFTVEIELPPFTWAEIVRTIVSYLITLPQYIALFLYGWKSQELWNAT